MATETVTLWYIEFCDNSQGIWHREWAASQGAAQTLHREKLDEFGEDADLDDDNHDGSYGDLRLPVSVAIDLTPRGVLEFANEFATEEDPA